MSELRREIGEPPETTLRSRVEALCRMGVLCKRRLGHDFARVEYGLTARGGELHATQQSLEAWLEGACGLRLESDRHQAKAAISSLLESWALAVRGWPRQDFRDLAEAGLIEQVGGPVEHPAPPHLRDGVGTILSLARWSHRHGKGRAAPFTAVEVETALACALHSTELGGGLSGECRLGVESRQAAERTLHGLTIEIADGRVVAATNRLGSAPESWIAGPIDAWLDAALTGRSRRLHLGGRGDLPAAVLEGVRRGLRGREAI
jgi:hypothetical protein